MKYFLDTNIIIYFMKGSYPGLLKHMREVPSQSIVIPAVVMAEIEYGAQKSRDYRTTIEKYTEFTKTFELVPFSGRCTKVYGNIRSYLEKSGSPIGPNDLMIAATVLANDGILVTHNTKEFPRVPGLIFEDWTL